MPLTLLNQVTGAMETGNRAYDPKWLRTMESLLADLLKEPGTTTTPVEPMLAQRYQGDFYGLLLAIGIQSRYHWVIMRANGMNTPTDFDGLGFQMVMPSTAFINENMTLFNTIYRNSL